MEQELKISKTTVMLRAHNGPVRSILIDDVAIATHGFYANLYLSNAPEKAEDFIVIQFVNADELRQLGELLVLAAQDILSALPKKEQ